MGATVADADAAGPNRTLFSNIVFYINDSLSPAVRDKLSDILTSNGAKACRKSAHDSRSSSPRFNADEITHVITDTVDFPEYSSLRPNSVKNGQTERPNGKGKVVETSTDHRVEIVTPFWVTRSYDMQTKVGCRFYSPDRAMTFSGICISCIDLPKEDAQFIRSAVESQGGQFRDIETRECTHVLAVAPHGSRYERIMKFGPDLGIAVVLPHWFEECLKLGQLVPTNIYQFPNPPLLTSLREEGKPFEERLAEYWASRKDERTLLKRPTATMELDGIIRSTLQVFGDQNGNVLLNNKKYLENYSREIKGQGVTASDTPNSNVPQIFCDRRVYLASGLGISLGLELALKTRIEEAGGRCWSWTLDGKGSMVGKARLAEDVLRSSDTVLTRTREGWEYWLAHENNKMIANLPWLHHVLAVGKLDSPCDRMLHYPLPSTEGLSEFQGLIMTISNYAGPARDYVRALIEALGAKFEGAMSRTTSYVVTASGVGNKVVHARNWGIPLVSHLWLEECLTKWAFVDPATCPVVLSDSSTQTNYTSILGNTPMPMSAIQDWARREEVVAARQAALQTIAQADKQVDGDSAEVTGFEGEENLADALEEAEEPVSVRKLSSKKRARKAVIENEEETEEIDIPAPPSVKTVAIAIVSAGKAQASPASEPSPRAATRDATVEKIKGNGKVTMMTVQMTTKTTMSPANGADAKAASERSSSPLSDQNSAEEEQQDDGFEAADAPQMAKQDVAAAKTPKRRKRRASTSSDGSSSSGTPVLNSATAITRTYTLVDAENIVVGGSRRAAAGRAAAKLADLMPDANRFAQELKSSGKKRKRPSNVPKRRSGGSGDEDEEESAAEDDEPPAVKARGKAAAAAASAVKKRAAQSESDGDDRASNTGSVAGKSKGKTESKKSRLAQVQQTGTTQPSGAISSFDNPPRGKPPAKVKKVMVMSTGLTLDAKSQEIKALKSLGATWTDQPGQVTHLVVKGLSRTEKFLRCLAAAPVIVTKEWIDACIEAGRLVDEAPYLLKDRQKEKEINDTLVEILDRARSRRLFDDVTVYITKGVKPDAQTIQKICQSGNATVIVSKMTSAMQQSLLVNDNAYIVSCPEDRQVWDALSQKGKPIHSVEAVFQSVMHQDMRGFKNPNNRVDLQLH